MFLPPTPGKTHPRITHIGPVNTVELSREQPGDKIYVRAVDVNGITIADNTYHSPLILSPNSIYTNWTVNAADGISEETLRPVFEFEPEVVIIGTGKVQHFLDPEIMMLFHHEGIGIEVMSTQAACRTFNILVMEDRNVVAALIPADTA